MTPAPSPPQRLQLRALAISVVALIIPVAGALWFPTRMADYEALLWLLALIPAFLLAYERGWRGVATALAFGMAVLSITYAVGRIYGHSVPHLLWAVVVLYLILSLCLGWLAERFERERAGLASRAAFLDPLTALPDRRYADFYLELEFAAAARGRPLAVALIQIDDLAGLRTRKGRAAGDETLRRFARHIAHVTRRMNLSARYGDDTFLCVLGSCDEEGAVVFAQRVQGHLRGENELDVPDWPTTSVGIAAFHPAMVRPPELIVEAEHALTAAREQGGDRIRVAGRPMDLTQTAADEAAGDEAESARGAATDPLRGFPAGAAAALFQQPGGLGEGRRALIFAPDAGVCERLEAEFSDESFRVTSCSELPEAIEALQNEFDVLVTDLGAGAPAHAIISDARSRWPATRVVGVPPEHDSVAPPEYLGTRVEAYYLLDAGFQAFRRALAGLLAERDWIVATAIGNRQLADEVRATSRESRLMMKRTEEILNRSQKMDAVGRLAGGIAHDFNNLLTTVRGHTELLISDLPETDPIREELLEIREAATRATALTRQLLAFSSRQVMQPRIIDLGGAIRDLDKMLRRVIGEDIELSVDIPELPLRVKADPAQIDQVLINLAVNARDAMPDGGQLTILLAPESLTESNELGLGLEPGGYALITFADTGHGMDEATLARIFEPFFTTKEAGKGTGLGLSTAYGIIRQSGGHIAVDSMPERGTTFRILLPRVDEPIIYPRNADAMPVDRDSAPHGMGETILLVEDEAPVRKLVSRILNREGYEVITAENGGAALEQLKTEAASIDLLVTDVVMPGMGGPELAAQVRELRPDAQILFISGYSEDAIPTHGVLIEDAEFLEKPFTPDEIALRVREMLARRRGPSA